MIRVSVGKHRQDTSRKRKGEGDSGARRISPGAASNKITKQNSEPLVRCKKWFSKIANMSVGWHVKDRNERKFEADSPETWISRRLGELQSYIAPCFLLVSCGCVVSYENVQAIKRMR